jgi:hypothetical protein
MKRIFILTALMVAGSPHALAASLKCGERRCNWRAGQVRG